LLKSSFISCVFFFISYRSFFIVSFVSLWSLLKSSQSSFSCFCLLKSFICGVLIFLECILYFLVNSVLLTRHSYHGFLSDLIHNFLFEIFFVGITEFIGDIYHCFVGVSDWVCIFFISQWIFYWIVDLWGASRIPWTPSSFYASMVCWAPMLLSD
jgi:hypothetical protein